MQPYEVRERLAQIEEAKNKIALDLEDLQQHCSHEGREKTDMVQMPPILDRTRAIPQYRIGYWCPDCHKKWKTLSVEAKLIDEIIDPKHIPYWKRG